MRLFYIFDIGLKWSRIKLWWGIVDNYGDKSQIWG